MTKVKLIAVTTPVDGTTSSEDLVAYIARVSAPNNQANTSTSKKLLKYLVDNQHWSPFEMVHMVMEIETPRDIARQIIRHRSFAFQEFSQRYANVDAIEQPVLREARFQDTKNRQNSLELDLQKDSERLIAYQWEQRQKIVKQHSKDAYDWAISKNLAKEVARTVLPEGLTMSRLYMAGTLRSWIHYCGLRMDKATQKEHREVAKLAWECFVKQYPSVPMLGE